MYDPIDFDDRGERDDEPIDDPSIDAAAAEAEQGILPSYAYDVGLFRRLITQGARHGEFRTPRKCGAYIMPFAPLLPGAQPDLIEGAPCPFGSGVGNASIDLRKLATHAVEIDAPDRPLDGRATCALIAAQMRTVAQAVAAGMPEPTVIVASGWPRRGDPLIEYGRSIHVYWRMHTPYPYAFGDFAMKLADIARWQRVQLALVTALGADPHGATTPAKRHRLGGVEATLFDYGRPVARRLQPIVWASAYETIDRARMIAWADKHPAPEVAGKERAEGGEPGGARAPSSSSRGIEHVEHAATSYVRLPLDPSTIIVTAAGQRLTIPEAIRSAPRCYATHDRWRVCCPSPTHHPSGAPDTAANALCAIARSRSLYISCGRCRTTWTTP